MIRIGRKIVHDNTSILYDSGEHIGDVKKKRIKELFPSFDQNDHELIELSYGERSEEINHRGSWEIVDGQLIIYPHFSVSVDKREIIDDGQDEAITTIETEAEQVTFYVVEDEEEYIELVDNGQVSFSFASNVAGTYHIEITTEKHGSRTVEIEVIANA